MRQKPGQDTGRTALKKFFNQRMGAMIKLNKSISILKWTESESGWDFVLSGPGEKLTVVKFPILEVKESSFQHPGSIVEKGSIIIDINRMLPRVESVTDKSSKAWFYTYPVKDGPKRFASDRVKIRSEITRNDKGNPTFFRFKSTIELKLQYVWDGERYVPAWLFNHYGMEKRQKEHGKKFHEQMKEAIDYWDVLKALRRNTVSINSEQKEKSYKSIDNEVADEAAIGPCYGDGHGEKPSLSKVFKVFDKLSERQKIMAIALARSENKIGLIGS